MTMSLTSKAQPYKKGYGPFAPQVYHLPHPALTKVEYFDVYWQDVFATIIEPNDIVAVIFEPVLGEGGFVPMPNTFIEDLKSRCENISIL